MLIGRLGEAGWAMLRLCINKPRICYSLFYWYVAILKKGVVPGKVACRRLGSLQAEVQNQEAGVFTLIATNSPVLCLQLGPSYERHQMSTRSNLPNCFVNLLSGLVVQY